MTAFVDISQALDEQLDAMAGKPSVSWENKSFTPVIGETYIRPTLIPGETVPETIGATGRDLNVGVYQVDVFTEAGKGKKALIEMMDKIALQFKHGTQLTSNSVIVEIKTVSQRPKSNDDNGWYTGIVEIVYYSFTARR